MLLSRTVLTLCADLTGTGLVSHQILSSTQQPDYGKQFNQTNPLDNWKNSCGCGHCCSESWQIFGSDLRLIHSYQRSNGAVMTDMVRSAIWQWKCQWYIRIEENHQRSQRLDQRPRFNWKCAVTVDWHTAPLCSCAFSSVLNWRDYIQCDSNMLTSHMAQLFTSKHNTDSSISAPASTRSNGWWWFQLICIRISWCFCVSLVIITATSADESASRCRVWTLTIITVYYSTRVVPQVYF